MNRWIWTLVLLSVFQFSEAARVILILSPAAAGPQIPLSIDDQPNWVKWPRWWAGKGLNRLLSIQSGKNWEGMDRYFQFRPAGPHVWKTDGTVGLQRKGFAVATAEHLDTDRFIALEAANGSVAKVALTVAMDPRFSEIQSLPASERLAADGLYVGEGKDWDEVERLRKRGADRILVVEYPPPVGQDFTHIWLRGTGWKNLTVEKPTRGAAGYLDVTDLVPLLNSDPVRTQTLDVGKNPRRWIAFGNEVAVTVGGLIYFVLALMAGVTAWAVTQERRVGWLQTIGMAALLGPAAGLFSGWLCQWLGPDGGVLWFVLALMGLAALSRLLAHLVSTTPILATFMTGALACLASQISYGPMSPVFTNFGAMGLAVFLAYLTGWAGASGSARSLDAVGLRLVALAFIFLPLWDSWWDRSLPSAVVWGLVVATMFTGEKWLPYWVSFVAAMGVVASRTLGHGVVTAPAGIYSNYWDDEAINITTIFQFLTSPAFLVTLALTTGIGFTGFRFLFHQVRRRRKSEPKLFGFLAFAGVLAITAAAYPALLPAVPVVWLMALLSLLTDVADGV